MGLNGTKAYVLAKKYTDTSILGTTGPLHGKSAYEIAVINGFVGTEADWLASLEGPPGQSPRVGANGNWEVWDLTTETWVDTGTLAPAFPDAPNDGEIYGRQDETWVKVSGAGGDTTDAIKLAQPITISSAWGNWKVGDTIPANTTLTQILTKGLSLTTYPTYTQPAISLNGTTPLTVEIGSMITPVLTPTWVQNDGGAATAYVLRKNGAQVFSGVHPVAHTEAQYQLTTSVGYQGTVTYAQGPVKNDSDGNPYPTGQIAAGSKNTNTVTYAPFRYAFYGVSSVASPTAPTTSAQIRALAGKTANVAQGTQIPINIPSGTSMVVIAYDATQGYIDRIMSAGSSVDVSSAFVRSTVSVEGANGYGAIDYYVYTMIPDLVFSSADTYTVYI